MKNFKSLFTAIILLFIASFTVEGQGLTYGFTKAGNNYTAVAIPNFTSNNVTISSAVFSFLLPEGTVTSPSVPNLPDAGSFINHTGEWQVQVLKPSDYENMGFNPSELEGNDVYLVVLHNAPSPEAVAGQAISLFTFELPNACTGGSVEVLTNNSAIQQSIYNNLSANFNNQMSMSVNDASSEDIYSGNDPATYAYFCSEGPEDEPQELNYGFTKVGNSYTAVAIPNFTSDNVTISSAVFSFLLPEGTVTSPSVPNLPDAGSFINHTGEWQVQVLKPSDYENMGFNPSELEGNDVYLVVLHNAPSPEAIAGQAISLFTFELPNACTGGSVEVLTNNSAIQQSIYNNLSANFNNQMSMSVNDASSEDIYSGNDPATFSYACPEDTVDGVPVAMLDKVKTRMGQAVTIDVLANDDFGYNGPGSGSIQVTVAPQFGTAVIDTGADPYDQSDDLIVYTPNVGFLGNDVLTYQICDADGDCDQAKAKIRVRLFSTMEASTDIGIENNYTPAYVPASDMVVKNSPNPFRDITTLGFEISTPGPVSIHIFSSQGQLLQKIDRYFDNGKHQIELDASNWQTSGMIIYDIHTPDYKTRGKMIRLD